MLDVDYFYIVILAKFNNLFVFTTESDSSQSFSLTLCAI